MIRCHHIVEYQPPEALLGLEDTAHVTASVPRKLQQECPLVAAVTEVPDVTGSKMAVGKHTTLLILSIFVDFVRKHRYPVCRVDAHSYLSASFRATGLGLKRSVISQAQFDFFRYRSSVYFAANNPFPNSRVRDN